MYKEFVVLDVETTGVDAKRDDIIEFAAVRLNDKGEVIGQMDILISTNQEISPTVTALTGITIQDLANKGDFDAVRDEIKNFIGEAPIVGHNIGFDIEFLNVKECDLGNVALDTLELAHTVLPAQSYYSLEYLASHFNFSHKPSHRAMDDVLAAVDLFKLLTTQVTSWSPSTKEAIAKLVPKESWSWGWLILEPPSFAVVDFKEGEDDAKLTAKLVQAAVESNQWLDQIDKAKTGPVNLIECHFPSDSLALALAYAVHTKPAVLVVDPAELWKTDWQEIGKHFSVSLVRFSGLKDMYDPDSEEKLAGSGKSLSSLEASMITKIIVWRQEWGTDSSKLFLSQEERYQWEQKFSPLADVNSAYLSDADVIVASAQALTDIPDLKKREIITARPLLLEDYAIFSQSRIFSTTYFNAAISSRRDFVHQHIRPQDTKLADELFKLLHRVSSSLTQVAQELIRIYAGHPPTSIYERDIELDETMVSVELKTQLGSITSDIQSYITQLASVESPYVARQIEQSQRLLSHLQAFKILEAGYRYFLYADQNRFFLELVPSQIDFSNLQQIISESRGFTVVSPGLSVSGSFDYFKLWLEQFSGKVIAPDAKTDLLLVGEDDRDALAKFTGQLLQRDGVSLVLATSAFEAREVFNQLYGGAQQTGGVLESYDTIGNVITLPQTIAQHKNLMLIGHYHWIRQIKWYQDSFDRIILGKMPFDPISRPRFKVLGDREGSFGDYTLPRAIMRLKETLHLVKLWNKPLILVDGRLLNKDYGQRVINSLNSFTVIPSGADEALQ